MNILEIKQENKKSYNVDEYNMTTQNYYDLALCKLIIRYMREVCNDEEKIRSVLRKDYSYDIYEIALKELKKDPYIISGIEILVSSC